jgi:hypothetical protein
MLPPRLDPDRVAVPHARTGSRFDQSHGCGDLLIEVGILRVVGDREHIDPTLGGNDVTIAEIPTQQPRVRRLIELSAIAPRTWRCPEPLAARQPLALIEAAPTTNRLDGDAMDLGVGSIADAVVRHPQGRINRLLRSEVRHGNILALATDSFARIWPAVRFARRPRKQDNI